MQENKVDTPSKPNPIRWPLVIALLALAVSVASLWLVFNRTGSEDKTADTSATEEQQDDENRADSWQLATSGQGGFSIRIPDGWRVSNDKTGDFMVAGGASDTVFRPSVPAQIEEIEGFGTDAQLRLTIYQYEEGERYSPSSGEKKVGEFKTTQTTGTKYFYQWPVEQTEGLGPLPGTLVYTYVFEHNGKVVSLTYTQSTVNEFTAQFLAEDQPNIVPIVEEMLSTLVIN